MSDPARRHRRYSAPPERDDIGVPTAPGGARALLVGATGPFARPVALALAQVGWAVVVPHGPDADAAQAVVADLPGQGHAAVAADPGDAQAVARLTAGLERAGGVDLVVDVSGVSADLPDLGATPEDWADALTGALTVALLGPATVAHAAAQAMVRSGRPGSIVVVSGSDGGSALGGAVLAGRQGLAGGLAAELRGTAVAVSTVVAGTAGPDQVAAGVLSVARGSSATLSLR